MRKIHREWSQEEVSDYQQSKIQIWSLSSLIYSSYADVRPIYDSMSGDEYSYICKLFDVDYIIDNNLLWWLGDIQVFIDRAWLDYLEDYQVCNLLTDFKIKKKYNIGRFKKAMVKWYIKNEEALWKLNDIQSK